MMLLLRESWYRDLDEWGSLLHVKELTLASACDSLSTDCYTGSSHLSTCQLMLKATSWLCLSEACTIFNIEKDFLLWNVMIIGLRSSLLMIRWLFYLFQINSTPRTLKAALLLFTGTSSRCINCMSIHEKPTAAKTIPWVKSCTTTACWAHHCWSTHVRRMDLGRSWVLLLLEVYLWKNSWRGKPCIILLSPSIIALIQRYRYSEARIGVNGWRAQIIGRYALLSNRIV